MHMSAFGKRPGKKYVFGSLDDGGQLCFDFCLERDFYDSGHSRLTIYSVLIDGGPRLFCHKRDKQPFPVKYVRMHNGVHL